MKIPFKSKLARYRNIDNRNKAFNAMSPKEQRVEMAYDALMLLIQRKLEALSSHGYWDYELRKFLFKAESSKCLQKSLCNLKKKQCTVCAKGALMVSMIRLGNNIDPIQGNAHESIPQGTMEEKLKGFSRETWDSIERRFESTWYSSRISLNETDNQFLGRILCNIIKNGDFVKSDMRDYLKLWDIKL